MKPSPTQTAAGLRRILKDVVAPELSSDHARQRLEEVRVVLAQMDWDDAGLALRRRVAALQELLRDDEELRTTFAALQDQHERLAAAVTQRLVERPDDDQLRAAVVRLLLA